MRRNDRSPRIRDKLIGLLLGIVACGISVYFAYTNLYSNFLLKRASAGWQANACTIEVSNPGSRKVKSVKSHSRKTIFHTELSYRYQVNGRTYYGNRLDFSNDYESNYDDIQQILSRFPVGRAVTCYVDPAAPENVVLERTSRDALKLATWCTVGFLVGLLLIFLAIPEQQTSKSDVDFMPQLGRAKVKNGFSSCMVMIIFTLLMAIACVAAYNSFQNNHFNINALGVFVALGIILALILLNLLDLLLRRISPGYKEFSDKTLSPLVRGTSKLIVARLYRRRKEETPASWTDKDPGV